jgi:hypothetical protein
LSRNFAARDAELDQLKMLVKQLADKVNAEETRRRTSSPRWKTAWMKWPSMVSA